MPVQAMLRLSLSLRYYIDRIGKFGSMFIMPLVAVTIWDVAVRKIKIFGFSIQLWMIENLGSAFESTKIQELEWHFHTALFTLVLGYCFVNNRHVRVDLVRENLSFRKQAWIEFLGCSFFLIPYCLIVGYFAFDYAYSAFLVGEISPSTVGLHYRWIIKFVLVIGLFIAAASGFAVWLQAGLVLFGPKELRFELMTLDWPEDQEARGGSTRRSGAV
ncbi:MAG: TRAP transporter small permease subunit [SAR324 cluster bacterium]|nr:TRAP transporter small permease subunit [SAR324 cluster bacterium]